MKLLCKVLLYILENSYDTAYNILLGCSKFENILIIKTRNINMCFLKRILIATKFGYAIKIYNDNLYFKNNLISPVIFLRMSIFSVYLINCAIDF